MIGTVLCIDDLRKITGYSREADVERCLRKQGIRYFWGRDGVWTTTELINAAAGIATSAAPAKYKPDDFA